MVWVADYLPWTGWGGCAQGFAAITSWRGGWTLAGLSPEAGSKVTLVDLVDRQATRIWDRTEFQVFGCWFARVLRCGTTLDG